ncbi:transcription initiation factor tfiid complex subunit taf12 [Cystoisospora suis]|uniref:Transcription initiation factor tfiid complex subunit taf12 n=1 Tax=Cystoisospora suis TaxID=483139 RepID=A0A2C6KMW6_9APIC|nr:transcription initiation factor tfiid complex subunit taf12 [Cystoisospora suis]
MKAAAVTSSFVMSPSVRRGASPPGCEGDLELTGPGCLARVAQAPCVIGVDVVRRALRDIDFDADIDRAAAQVVCDLLDTFTADVASQAAGVCRSRGGKIVTRDDLQFSLARLGIPAAVLDHARRGDYRPGSMEKPFSFSPFSFPSCAHPSSFPPFSLPRQFCSAPSSSSASLRSLIQQSQQRQQRLLRQVLREQRESASTPGARPEGGRKIRVRTVSHHSKPPCTADVSSVYSAASRLSSLGADEGSSRVGAQSGQSGAVERTAEGRREGECRETGGDDGRSGSQDAGEKNEGPFSGGGRKGHVTTPEANSRQGDEQGERGEKSFGRGQVSSSFRDEGRVTSGSVPKGLTGVGGERPSADGEERTDPELAKEESSAGSSGAAPRSSRPVYMAGILAAERTSFPEDGAHVQQNVPPQTSYYPGSRPLHYGSGVIPSARVPCAGHDITGVIPEIVVTSPVPPFNGQVGHSFTSENRPPSLVRTSPQPGPPALPRPPSSAATLNHLSSPYCVPTSAHDEGLLYRQMLTPLGVSPPPYPNGPAAQKHMFMTPHQEADRSPYSHAVRPGSGSPVPGGLSRGTGEIMPGHLYPNTVPGNAPQAGGYLVPVFFDPHMRADRRNRMAPAGLSEVTPLKGSLPGGGRINIGGAEDLK